MSIVLVNGSCAQQQADAVVNAANRYLQAGGGICGAIFSKAGVAQLQAACNKYPVPLQDGEAVTTPAFGLRNAKVIIHAVGPNFAQTPAAFDKLYMAYYNSLLRLKESGLHSIAFPLISSGIFGGNLEKPSAVSAKECIHAYRDFSEAFPAYEIEAVLCAYSLKEFQCAREVFEKI